MPASAAAQGLGKADRAAENKTTSVLGQIFIASILPRGGDGKDVVATFGGQLPPHIKVDVRNYLVFSQPGEAGAASLRYVALIRV